MRCGRNALKMGYKVDVNREVIIFFKYINEMAVTTKWESQFLIGIHVCKLG